MKKLQINDQELESDNLLVEYKGKKTYLNPKLIIQQGLDKETIDELKLTHEDRFRIFEAMENTNDPEELREFAAQMEVIEFEQQRLWGFPQDRNYHKWYLVPKCICPSSDNADRYGTEYRVINEKCPVHGIKN
jgi:hypothetical protein